VARSKIQTYSLLALAMFLFVGLAWSLDLTAFNMWVAGGPPVQAQEIYAHLGKVFLAVSIGFLLAFLLVLWTLIRNRKHQVP
jgi:TRAP-type C4-dicarboxylate transport system permease small subunit